MCALSGGGSVGLGGAGTLCEGDSVGLKGAGSLSGQVIAETELVVQCVSFDSVEKMAHQVPYSPPISVQSVRYTDPSPHQMYLIAPESPYRTSRIELCADQVPLDPRP
eukprot:3941315-Rhodomonas_salina.3